MSNPLLGLVSVNGPGSAVPQMVGLSVAVGVGVTVVVPVPVSEPHVGPVPPPPPPHQHARAARRPGPRAAAAFDRTPAAPQDNKSMAGGPRGPGASPPRDVVATRVAGPRRGRATRVPDR